MTTLMTGLKLKNGGVISIVGAGGKTSLMFRLAAELSGAGESVLTTTTTRIFLPDKGQSPEVVIGDSLKTILEAYAAVKKTSTHMTAGSRVFIDRKDPPSHAHILEQHQKLVGFEPEFIDEIYATGVFRWILVEADGAAGRPLKAPASFEPVIPQSSTLVVGVLGLDGVGKPLNADSIFRPDQFGHITGLIEGEPVTAADCVTSILHKNGIMKDDSSRAERIVFLNKADQSGRMTIARQITRLMTEKYPTDVQRVVIGQVLQDPPVLEFLDLNP